jgi:hypothetical protein
VQLHFSPGPPGGAAVARRFLVNTIQRGNFPAGLGPAPAPATLKVREPLEIYQLGGDSWDSADAIGDRYAIDSGGQQVAVEDVAVAAARTQVLGQTFGDVNLSATIDHLATMPEIPDGGYEVRFLYLPAAHNGDKPFVLWLKADAGGVDQVFTLGHAPPDEPEHLFAADKYLLAIKPYLLQAAIAAANAPAPSAGALQMPHPAAAAAAVLDVVITTGADTAYVSGRIHQTLFTDLKTLEAAANAVATDDGLDPVKAGQNIGQFSRALQETISRAKIIAGRASESQDAKDKSNALAEQLTDAADK